VTPEDALNALAAVLAPLVAAELRRQSSAEIVDQKASPLGPRRHCAIVRARMLRGDNGASIVGRRFYLTRSALDEEVRAVGARVVAKPTSAKVDDPLDDLRRRFPLPLAG
jgi:hypothetical protein